MKSLRQWGPGGFFALDVLYTLVLATLLVGRSAHWLWVDHIHDPIGGVIPIGVPWFGALGGLTISIYGVVDNNHRWQTRWTLWHAIRPLVGAILGTVGYLIFIGLIQATGTSPTLGTASHSPSTSSVLYLVIAFVIGFREQTFRSLIQRVVDLLLSPGDTSKAPSVSITPSPVDFGEIAIGQHADAIVTVTNSGSAPLIIKPGQDTPPGVALQGAGFAIESNALDGATINPLASGTLAVRFVPAHPGTHPGTIALTSNAGTFVVPIVGIGAA